MGYSIEIMYGSLSVTHSCDDETREALADGSYASVLGQVTAHVYTAIESGMLDDEQPELKVPEVDVADEAGTDDTA